MLLLQKQAPRISEALGCGQDYTVLSTGNGFSATRSDISCQLPAEQATEAHPEPQVRKTGTLSSWIADVLSNYGVLASIPSSKHRNAAVVALDPTLSSGAASYFCAHLQKSEMNLNAGKTRSRRGKVVYEAVTLLDGEPASFLPDGRAYGMSKGAIDDILAAGFSVDVMQTPYMHEDNIVSVKKDQQKSCVANELAYLFDAASRGIAPAVLACFAVPFGEVAPQDVQSAFSVVEHKPAVALDQIDALAVVSHVSTFTLDDVMAAFARESEPALRTKLRGTLIEMCGPVFKQIRTMCALHKQYGMVKINMIPSNIAFCPKLVEDGDSWKLEGHGHRAISQTFLDGTPFLTDFNSLLTMRIKEEQYSADASFVLHSLVLVSCARAIHGRSVSRVLWDHLMSDKEVFLPAVRAMNSKATNTSAFLAHIARSYETRKFPELSRITAEITSDMDRVLRSGLITASNDFAMPSDTQLFSKLVSTLTGSVACDTRIFDIVTSHLGEREEVDAHAALEAVKRERMRRVAATA